MVWIVLLSWCGMSLPPRLRFNFVSVNLIFFRFTFGIVMARHGFRYSPEYDKPKQSDSYRTNHPHKRFHENLLLLLRVVK